eukprot:INCI3118.2.p1 GENE.INCI3118.2~~INCI3118.2.p1  ORF type:complete len:786 (+),score=106.15 INCI3118.2:257-2614(+)
MGRRYPRAASTGRLLVVTCFVAFSVQQPVWGVDTYGELLSLRETTREMFQHSFDNYLQFGFPFDELRPLECKPRRWDKRERGTLDDNLGGFALTLVDAADTLALMGDREGFQQALNLIRHNVTFNNSIVVSVFETTIRVLGGLLSSHQLASDPELNLVPGYDGWLLERAAEVGERLLPAFETKTGIPYHRVHLLEGVPKGETEQTCLAAAGTLLLEFGALSRLTGDHRFEAVAARAVDELWSRRSQLDLLGNTISVRTGRWAHGLAGTGPGRDSFYEYLLKSYILFGDERYYDMWLKSLQALDSHSAYGPWHAEVDMSAGRSSIRPLVVSSLQAFWPALLVLAGDIDQAQLTFKGYYDLWNVYGSLPEGYQVKAGTPLSFGKDYPLRPELIESAFALFGATNATFYLEFGKSMVTFLQQHCRVPCGFASIADVRTKRLDDRMDSYFLAETLKYLFLLFDAALTNIESHAPGSITADDRARVAQTTSPLRLDPASYIFSTEGHVFLNHIGHGTAQKTPPTLDERRAAAQAAAGVVMGETARKLRDANRTSSQHKSADDSAIKTASKAVKSAGQFVDLIHQVCEIHDELNDRTTDVMSAGSMLKIFSRPETTRPRSSKTASRQSNSKATGPGAPGAATEMQLSKKTAETVNLIAQVSEHYHVECTSVEQCQFVANPVNAVNVIVSWSGRKQAKGGASRSVTLPAALAQFGLPMNTPESEKNLVPAGSEIVVANPRNGCEAAATTNAAEFAKVAQSIAGMSEESSRRGLVALVERGGCTFASKARVRR